MGRVQRLRRTAPVAVGVVLALVLSGCTAGGRLDPPAQRPGGFSAGVTERLEATVAEAMGLADASAGLVGVWAPWAGEWTDALGTTERGGGVPVSPDMTFRAGQITTAMSCTVFLSLVDAGTVELDDPSRSGCPGSSARAASPYANSARTPRGSATTPGSCGRGS